MDFAIGGSRIQPGQLQGPETTGAPKPGGPAPEANDVERFQEAMSRHAEAGAGGGAAQPPPADAAQMQPQPPAQETGEASLGDRILRGFGAVSQKINAGQGEAVNVLGKENVTQADLLRANFSMLESNTLVTAIGKTTEKVTQGVKTLQQG